MSACSPDFLSQPVSAITRKYQNLGFKDKNNDGVITKNQDWYSWWNEEGYEEEADINGDGKLVEAEIKYYLHFVVKNADEWSKGVNPILSEDQKVLIEIIEKKMKTVYSSSKSPEEKKVLIRDFLLTMTRIGLYDRAFISFLSIFHQIDFDKEFIIDLFVEMKKVFLGTSNNPNIESININDYLNIGPMIMPFSLLAERGLLEKALEIIEVFDDSDKMQMIEQIFPSLKQRISYSEGRLIYKKMFNIAPPLKTTRGFIDNLIALMLSEKNYEDALELTPNIKENRFRADALKKIIFDLKLGSISSGGGMKGGLFHFQLPNFLGVTFNIIRTLDKKDVPSVLSLFISKLFELGCYQEARKAAEIFMEVDKDFVDKLLEKVRSGEFTEASKIMGQILPSENGQKSTVIILAAAGFFDEAMKSVQAYLLELDSAIRWSYAENAIGVNNLLSYLKESSVEIALVYPYIVNIIPENELADYLIQYDYAGQLTDKDSLKVAKRFFDGKKYDLENVLSDFLYKNPTDTPLVQIVRKLCENINHQREVTPVFMEKIRRIYRFDDPTQRPRDKDVYAYDLTLRILKFPNETRYAKFIIVDPRDKKVWPQNCSDIGDADCSINIGLNTFRIFLHKDNKRLKGYLKYYDQDGKFISRSNTFLIVNPDAK